MKSLKLKNMKTFRIFMLMLLAGTVVLSSCKKDDEDDNNDNNNNNNNNNTTYVMSAMVDNENWGSNTVVGIIDGTSEVTVTAVSTDNTSSMVLSIYDFTGVGEYLVTDDTDNSAYYTVVGSTSAWFAPFGTQATGTITITSFADSKITGTFSFTGINMLSGTNTIKVISSGTFTNVTLQTQ